METIIDLKKKTHIESVAALFLNYRPQDIIIPQSFEILISNDGKRFTHLTTVAYEGWPNNLHDCWSDIIMADGLDARTRFVKVRAVATSGSILCAGIHVNR